jgi:hypothetical protein
VTTSRPVVFSNGYMWMAPLLRRGEGFLFPYYKVVIFTNKQTGLLIYPNLVGDQVLEK